MDNPNAVFFVMPETNEIDKTIKKALLGGTEGIDENLALLDSEHHGRSKRGKSIRAWRVTPALLSSLIKERINNGACNLDFTIYYKPKDDAKDISPLLLWLGNPPLFVPATDEEILNKETDTQAVLARLTSKLTSYFLREKNNPKPSREEIKSNLQEAIKETELLIRRLKELKKMY